MTAKQKTTYKKVSVAATAKDLEKSIKKVNAVLRPSLVKILVVEKSLAPKIAKVIEILRSPFKK